MPRFSDLADSYRRNAELARTEAEQSPLPRVRARAAAAVELWIEMADRHEQYDQQLQEREAAMVRRKEEAHG